MEKKQHLLVIAYAITIHESQGSDLEFIAGNLNYANDKEPCDDHVMTISDHVMSFQYQVMEITYTSFSL